MWRSARTCGAADAFGRVVELASDWWPHIPRIPTSAIIWSWPTRTPDSVVPNERRRSRRGQGHDKALDVGSKLLRDYPESAPYHNAYASALSNQGVFLRLRGQCDQAVAAIKQSIEHQRIAIARDPGTDYYKMGLVGHLADLAVTLRICGRIDEAVATLRQRRALGLAGAVEHYNDACMFALCVPQIHDAARKQEVAEEAIAGLRAAIASGWTDAGLTCAIPTWSRFMTAMTFGDWWPTYWIAASRPTRSR